jgi:hypothetical protein
VGAPALVLSRFESDDWNAEFYTVMALASRLALLVKSHAQVFSLAIRLRRLDSALCKLFREKVYKTLESPQVQTADPEKVREGIITLRRLYRTIHTIIKASKHIGLTNNSLTAGPLRNIEHWGEEIIELADLAELTQSEDVIQSIYDRAAQEKERGELYDLGQVE